MPWQSSGSPVCGTGQAYPLREHHTCRDISMAVLHKSHKLHAHATTVLAKVWLHLLLYIGHPRIRPLFVSTAEGVYRLVVHSGKCPLFYCWRCLRQGTPFCCDSRSWRSLGLQHIAAAIFNRPLCLSTTSSRILILDLSTPTILSSPRIVFESFDILPSYC